MIVWVPGSSNDLDAVTLDAFGTLVELADPLPTIAEALRSRGVERDRNAIARAFATEGEYYRANAIRCRDGASLVAVQTECAGVFLSALRADLDPAEFAPAYVGALRFEAIPGIAEDLARLRALGLELAVVANWEISVHWWLAELGLAEFFSTIVTAAEVGAAKPDPRIFHVALERLGVQPDRALHIGDEEVDREGALAAGMGFAPTPVATAVAQLA